MINKLLLLLQVAERLKEVMDKIPDNHTIKQRDVRLDTDVVLPEPRETNDDQVD